MGCIGVRGVGSSSKTYDHFSALLCCAQCNLAKPSAPSAALISCPIIISDNSLPINLGHNLFQSGINCLTNMSHKFNCGWIFCTSHKVRWALCRMLVRSVPPALIEKIDYCACLCVFPHWPVTLVSPWQAADGRHVSRNEFCLSNSFWRKRIKMHAGKAW